MQPTSACLRRSACNIRDPRRLDELNRGNARLNTAHDILTVLQNRQLCLTQLAVLQYSGILGGRRRQQRVVLVLDRNGKPIHDQLGEEWRYKLETIRAGETDLAGPVWDGQGDFKTWWVDVRPIPTDDSGLRTSGPTTLKGQCLVRDNPCV